MLTFFSVLRFTLQSSPRKMGWGRLSVFISIPMSLTEGTQCALQRDFLLEYARNYFYKFSQQSQLPSHCFPIES